MIRPELPPYDGLEWRRWPLERRMRAACEAWGLQGYGTPLLVYVAYGLKVALYLWAWLFFCGLSPALGGLDTLGDWWLHPVAFQKAILWNMLFEILGLGCGSGPLTGRYLPPVGGALYFLRPGTLRLPPWPHLPIFGGTHRGLIDVALYAGLLGVLLWALCSSSVGLLQWALVVGLLPLMGLRDKTLFLAARAEHYFYTAVCMLWLSQGEIAWAGAKAVALAIWFWAGVSKLTAHFPTVVCVMVSNSPVARLPWLRRKLYRDFPEDMRPSWLAKALAHGGGALEFAVPLVLGLASGGDATLIGLGLMLFLHTYITTSVPMGVPIEWNVMVVYGGFFLFSGQADLPVLSTLMTPEAWPLAGLLLVGLVGIPLWGNLKPSQVSFLLSMRYYAGNWPYSIWLFKGESWKKLNRLKMLGGFFTDQLGRLYDESTCYALMSKMMAFRAMHLQGRALQTLLPRAVDRFEDYEYSEGELIAGLALGWNFGDGHLHHQDLLDAIQARCGFEPGELRCVMVEAQPLAGATMAYVIADAADGVIERGQMPISKMLERQPWGPSE